VGFAIDRFDSTFRGMKTWMAAFAAMTLVLFTSSTRQSPGRLVLYRSILEGCTRPAKHRRITE